MTGLNGPLATALASRWRHTVLTAAHPAAGQLDLFTTQERGEAA